MPAMCPSLIWDLTTRLLITHPFGCSFALDASPFAFHFEGNLDGAKLLPGIGVL